MACSQHSNNAKQNNYPSSNMGYCLVRLGPHHNNRGAFSKRNTTPHLAGNTARASSSQLVTARLARTAELLLRAGAAAAAPMPRALHATAPALEPSLELTERGDAGRAAEAARAGAPLLLVVVRLWPLLRLEASCATVSADPLLVQPLPREPLVPADVSALLPLVRPSSLASEAGQWLPVSPC